MTLLVFYVLLALGVSFICSLLEATLLSVTPGAIASARQRGAGWADAMAQMKDDVEKPLSAILTLNTIAHTMGAAGAGAEYARQFGNASEALFAAGLTLAILVATEIIPKTWGAHYANALAGPTTRMLLFLVKVMAPFVWMARQITRIVKPGADDRKPVSREELLAMARLGAQIGELRESETVAMENLMQLHQLKARDIMTPRTVMFSLPSTMPVGEAVREVESRPFSRIPLQGKGPEDLKGFVLRTDILLSRLRDPEADQTLADLARPLELATRDTPLDRLFRRFVNEQRQIMQVVDEFGTVVGIVTLEDIVETVFGIEIVDEQDRVDDMQRLARRLWEHRARKMGIRMPEEPAAAEDAGKERD